MASQTDDFEDLMSTSPIKVPTSEVLGVSKFTMSCTSERLP